MDVNWLKDLVEVESKGNFSRAAQARNVSVSSLSRRIQLLEEWANHPLVDRTSHPIRLTAAGEVLLPVAQAVLSELERVRTRLNPAAQRLPVRFLAPSAVSVAVFPRLLAALQGALGALLINLIPDNFREVIRRFGAGEAEFALYYVCDEFVPRLPMGRGESVMIARDVLIPVARSNSARKGSQAKSVRVVVLDDASYLGRITKAAMLRHRIEYEVALSGTQILAIRQIVIEGGGMAWLPASLVAEDLEAHRLVRVRRDFPSIPFTIHAARQPFPLSPDHEAVWEKLKEFGEAGRVLDFGEALR